MYIQEDTSLSVDICNFAIETRSSWLVAADMLVRGVLVELPLTEPVGVEAEVESVKPLLCADFFAAFSARRFCFEAEGAMVVEVEVRNADLAYSAFEQTPIDFGSAYQISA